MDAVQQVGLLLPEPQRQARKMVLGEAGSEPLHRPGTGVAWIPDGGRLGDEHFELAGLRSRLVLGAALDEDPLTRDRGHGFVN